MDTPWWSPELVCIYLESGLRSLYFGSPDLESVMWTRHLESALGVPACSLSVQTCSLGVWTWKFGGVLSLLTLIESGLLSLDF